MTRLAAVVSFTPLAIHHLSVHHDKRFKAIITRRSICNLGMWYATYRWDTVCRSESGRHFPGR
ncbi:MAG: hypothetical protein LBI96_04460 [Odoribacteraceae bacterium]|nr:hypothetical protein [Odoribacteraceae bacterium]